MLNEFSKPAREILDDQVKLPYSMGSLEKASIKLCEVQHSLMPEIINPVLIIAGGDHGVSQKSVTLSKQSVTATQCLNFANGNGACGVLAKENNVQMFICDAGVSYDFPQKSGIFDYKIAYGTKDFTSQEAMTKNQYNQCIQNGREFLRDTVSKTKTNTVILGEMGVGNTSSATCLSAALTGKNINSFYDCGYGESGKLAQQKFKILNETLIKWQDENPYSTDEFYKEKAMCKFGGFELVFLAGCMMESYDLGLTILLDGFIVSASLLYCYKTQPKILENVIAVQQSPHYGHGKLLDYMHLDPIFKLDLCLGEGTGALACLPLLKESLALFKKLETFSGSGVPKAYKRTGRKGQFGFFLGTTSYIIPADIPENIEYLKDKVEDIELVFFESGEYSNFPDKERINFLSKAAKENNLSYTVHLPYDFILGDGDEKKRKIGVEKIVDLINRVKNLPVFAYVIHAMPDNKNFYLPYENIEIWRKQTKKSIEEILRQTKIPSRMLCIEDLSYDFNYLWKMIDELNLGITLDVGHLWLFNSYNVELVRRMLPKTRVVHLHGLKKREDGYIKDHVSLRYLDREILKSFLFELKKLNNESRIVLTLELFSASDLDDSINILEEELL